MMCYRDPIDVVDQTLENLRYLQTVLSEDVDHGALDHDRKPHVRSKQPPPLKAIDALLPRLRVARLNHEVTPRLPDVALTKEFFANNPSTDYDDACEAPSPARHASGVR